MCLLLSLSFLAVVVLAVLVDGLMIPAVLGFAVSGILMGWMGDGFGVFVGDWVLYGSSYISCLLLWLSVSLLLLEATVLDWLLQ